ncbi:MAG: IMPACT family protein [Cellulomonadaceae bacterium]|jgi:uncharacterized YigZ family protein|nr:IMPACT family protein [Cellulomonadaceae bacterium]
MPWNPGFDDGLQAAVASPTGMALPSTIAAPLAHEIEIKRSRFIARLVPVGSVAQAEAEIAAVRKAAWDANHNCTAFIVGRQAEWQRSSDDGEPSGTAGVPMLEVLRRRNLTDLIAVVTRYFGGVMLGAGGLVRAYSTAVSQALDAAVIVRREWLTDVTVAVPYDEAGRVENLLRAWASGHGAAFGEPVYAANAQFTMAVPPHLVDQAKADIAAATGGRCQVEVGEQHIVDMPSSR